MSLVRPTNILMFYALRGEAVVSGFSSVMILISRSYLNNVSRPLRAYLFTCPWAITRTLFFYLVYWPPNISKTNFIEDFSSFVEGAALSCCENIILGDLNLPSEKQDSWPQKFNDSICQYNFIQIIDSPTHIHGHLLFVVCVRNTFSEAFCPKVTGAV